MAPTYTVTHSSDTFKLTSVLKWRWWIGASQALKETNPPLNIVANGVHWLNSGNRTDTKVSLVSTYLNCSTKGFTSHMTRSRHNHKYDSRSLCNCLPGSFLAGELREDRWLGRRFFASVSDNSNARSDKRLSCLVLTNRVLRVVRSGAVQRSCTGPQALALRKEGETYALLGRPLHSIGYFRSQFKNLNELCSCYIEKGSWPLCDYSLKKKVIKNIEQLQYEIAILCSLDRKDEALRYVEIFSFSLVVRVYSIESIRTRKSRSTPGVDESIIQNANDYASCLQLFSLTHPKNISYEIDMEVRYVEITKKDSTEVRVLDIGNIVDRALQLQLLVLLDPIVESTLPEHFYGYRKGRNPLQAIAFLSKSIQLSDLSRFYLTAVDITKCFDSISHDYILEEFPFPEKFKRLLHR